MSSLYPHSLYGGQPPYAGPSYASSAPPAGYYHHPHHQPQAPPSYYHVDAATFRRDFSSRLAELQFNSRPIIQSLSLMAQDHTRYADVVAQCLEAHIRRVPPWMKLPAFYVLDAISKNIYEPYARQFSSFVVPLYLETYRQVDDNTRGKMEEMLLTWRTGSPTGTELFGVHQQHAIERGVWGPGSTANSSNLSFQSGPSVITKSQVLSELNFTLGQKERAVQANPYDTLSQNHIHVLQQLRLHVEAGVSQEELRQILNQLRNLMKTTSAPPVPQPQMPSVPTTWPSQPPFPPLLPQGSAPPAPYSQPPAVVKSEAFSAGRNTSPQSTHSTSDNIANLLSTLLKAGVVSSSSTPVGAGASAGQLDVSKGSVVAGPSAESIREYRNKILSESINLNVLDSVAPSRIVELLYDRNGLQCKQCGIRFPDTKAGKKSQDDHLDMHFRQNRKANDDMGRGHSRSWFIGLDDWIQDVSGDREQKGGAEGSGRLNAKTAAAVENAKREADLRSQYVIVPPGEEARVLSCPICKETLKSEFLEDDEEWVWKNATKKDDKVYHATCYAEAIGSTSTLAARLRSEMAHGSRSGTPEVVHSMSSAASVRGTPPPAGVSVSGPTSKSQSVSPASEAKVAGTKRKVEHDDPNAREEVTGTPPLKKVAL